MNILPFPNKLASMLPRDESPRYMPAIHEASSRLQNVLIDALIDWCDRECVDINHITTINGVGLFASSFVDASNNEDSTREILSFYIQED
jgi:hypothetical protein